VARIFPRPSCCQLLGDELTELAEDIRKHGL
jgi:hypothetical protein